MSKIVNSVKQEIKDTILSAAGRCVAKGEFPAEPLPDFNIEIPGDRTHGDYAVNAAMVWARALKKAPRMIAEAIVNEITIGGYISRIEIAGPGFMNIYLSDRFYSDIVLDVLEQKENYGRSDYGKGKSVLVEFVSANPTGPMHIGNARGGALGDSIAAAYDWAGYEVKREFYVNDAGNQINKFKISLEARYLELFDDSVEIPEDAYLGDDIIAHAKAFAEIHGDKYVTADEDERRDALCDFALPKNIQKLKDDLLKYRITYDRWYLESDLHNSGAVTDIIEKLKASGYTYEQEGALWLKSTEFGDEKDRVLMRANGVPTYLVPDIAYHYDKLVTRNFDKAIDILGADHHGYIARMMAALTALGVDANRLKIVIMQMVRLVKNGETYKLSKRSGKAVTLETLLDEVPIDAARYVFNSKEPNTHLEFDLDLAVEQSSQNPVYYVQYAHARICSILRNLAAEGITPEALSADELDCLSASEEREVIRHLSSLPQTIINAAEGYDPALITRYAFDLATLFHRFYNSCRVKGEAENIMQARLSLCVAVKTTIANVLKLLKIDAPTEM
ncbi:MAG: arginine--tRNA ligase [Ruminococcaceae bacterium]|nr:arginine--tRNA ligase [Oscillospiraceae bacterium]